MRVLFLNCANGATPALLVSALAGAGLKPSALEWELSNIDLGDFHMHFDRKERDGVSGIAFTLHAGAHHGHGDCCGDADHDHDAPKLTLADLRERLAKSDLSERVQRVARDIFERLAAAEGTAQGVAPEAADLHEGGTLEGIAHVLIAAIGLEALGIGQVVVSPLREGKGWVQNASGSSAIPSPVTLDLLREAPLSEGPEAFQLLPPLAAAMLAGLADRFGERPAFTGETVTGNGISVRRFPPLPDIVRAEIGEAP